MWGSLRNEGQKVEGIGQGAGSREHRAKIKEKKKALQITNGFLGIEVSMTDGL
jgi:hypothetical protein